MTKNSKENVMSFYIYEKEGEEAFISAPHPSVSQSFSSQINTKLNINSYIA